MRRHFSHSVGLVSIALAVLAVAACDNNSSPVSPSAPDFSGFPAPSASLGATIQGQVNGLGGTGATALRSATADDAVMIQVLGTDVMDDVDPNGQFMLVDVPRSANVVLRISSSTLDETISLGAVSENETVTVVLVVAANSVEIVSEARDSSDDDLSDDDSSDDDSSGDDDDPATGPLTLAVDPDEWRLEWGNGSRSGSGGANLRIRIRGSGARQVNPSTVRLSGPLGTITPVGTDVGEDFEAEFSKIAAIGLIAPESAGGTVLITVDLELMDGTTESLTRPVRIRSTAGDDDSSDDDSSDDDSDDDSSDDDSDDDSSDDDSDDDSSDDDSDDDSSDDDSDDEDNSGSGGGDSDDDN